MVEVLSQMPGGELVQSEGFSQGLPRDDYMAGMLKAKYVPCPGGGVNLDSFRVYEALEAGCIPIAEGIEFWAKLLPDAPFPIIDDWWHLPALMTDAEWNVNDVMAWWLAFKRDLRQEIELWTTT